MKKLSVLVVCLLSSVLGPLFASAQAPQLINYQGRLLNGTNLVNGNVGLSLRLFNAAAAGTKLYEDSNTVAVADGLYSTFIGDHPTNATFLSALTNAAVWIEVAVNGVALAPRERLASVGYSLSTRGIAVDAANKIFVLNPAQNSVDPSATYSTLGGGFGNSIQMNAYESFLGAGANNSIQMAAYESVLGGGYANSIQPGANRSFIGGGEQNSVSGPYGTVPGGRENAAGQFSFAAGQRAKATDEGSFVWADSQNADFGTTSSNQFNVRASGGARIQAKVQIGSGTNAGNSTRGIIVRRVESTDSTANNTVARTDRIRLMRDGTFGGILIGTDTNGGNLTASAFGVNSSGTPVGKYIELPTAASNTVLFTHAENVVSFHATFGFPYGNGEVTEVVLSRKLGDNYWIGTITSSFDQ